MSDVLAAIGRVASGEKQLPDDAPEGMRQEHSLGGSSRSSAKRVGSMFPPRHENADPLASYGDSPLENGRRCQTAGRFHHQLHAAGEKAASGDVKIVKIGRFENRCGRRVSMKGSSMEVFRSRRGLSCGSLCLRLARFRRDGGSGRERRKCCRCYSVTTNYFHSFDFFAQAEVGFRPLVFSAEHYLRVS